MLLHFVTTPELNPNLSAQEIRILTFETFCLCLEDFYDVDRMVFNWNRKSRENPQAQVKFTCLRPERHHHDLRQTKVRDELYTFVDPRTYNWRASSATDTAATASRPSNGSTSHGMFSIVTSTGRWSTPKRLYADMDINLIRYLQKHGPQWGGLEWKYLNGHIHPSSKFLEQLDEGKVAF